MAKSWKNLMIVMVEDASRYCLSRDALACHILPETKENFSYKKRKHVIVLGTKRWRGTPSGLQLKPIDPKKFSNTFVKELGLFVMAGTPADEYKKTFGLETKEGITKQEELRALKEQSTNRFWKSMILEPKSESGQKYKDYYLKKFGEIEKGKPEVTHEIVLRKQGRLAPLEKYPPKKGSVRWGEHAYSK